jgi:precorrin-2 dehydrogenase/sirohydrochlorin ferrochelatase
VAERKIRSLLQSGALVRVYSPNITEQIASWAEAGKLTVIHREYRSGDLEHAFLVIAATDHAEVNLQVHRDTQADKLLINIVDRPDLCNFTVPSVVRRGKLLISVSTSGASPLLSRKIRDELEEVFGSEYEEYVDILSELRLHVREFVKDGIQREEIWKQLLGMDWKAMIRSGRMQEMKEIWIRRIRDLREKE